MTPHVCPWWIGYLLASPVRKLIQDPTKILAPQITEGMTVLEIGPGMGYFTIPMARLVGPNGRVIAVDLQERMLRSLERRAAKAGVRERVITRVCSAESLGIDDLAGAVDFALAFAVLHETPDIGRVLEQLHRVLKLSGRLLIAEPSGHVNEQAFAKSLKLAERSGFKLVDTPTIRRSRTALMMK